MGSEQDAGIVAGSRPRRTFRAGDDILDVPAPPVAHLFLSGGCTLLAETPFGPHPVARLAAPAIADLRAALGGSPGVSRVRPDPESTGVALGADETPALVLDAGGAGGAFRRLALASLTASIRETNASLHRFFDGTPRAAASSDPTRAHTIETDVDLGRASDLFETAGLDPAILPALGLTARTVLPGAALARTGDEGHEAYLVVEGRLRVSIDIAGAGPEAG